MEIYLLRHAQALSSYPDAERKLSVKGHQDARALGRFMGASSFTMPTQVWCSPFQRAQETLDAAQADWASEMPEVKIEEALLPEADPTCLVRQLADFQTDVLLVGHNPNLETLASLLISGERNRVHITLKTAVLIRLVWSPIPHYQAMGPAALQWMFDPRCLKH